MRKRSKAVAITFEFTVIYSVVFADSLNLLLSEYMFSESLSPPFIP